MIEQLNNKFNKITNDRAIHYKILENCIFDILDLFVKTIKTDNSGMDADSPPWNDIGI